ncbi:MAG: universal stress protein [Desulfobacterales bacterium]|nr:universal stress protein [Desulfobacterales bacterium]
MYKRILIPLDGSKLAESALAHAESLALKYNAELILLQVVRPLAITAREPAEIMMFQENMEHLRADAKAYLNGLKGEFREKKIRVEIYVGLGPVVAEIVETAATHSVDLVIIASHGRSGLGRVFFGSVASGVLNRIERPLMVIRSAET